MNKLLLPALLAVVVLMALAATGLFADEEKAVNAYIGDNATKCKMCHKDQVAAWEKWAMAKSWDKLSDEEKKKEECIKCHVTGYGQEGGWVSFEKTPNLAGIQCEACHGPAGNHMKVPMTDKDKRKATMAVPDEATCLKCHVKEGNPNFKDFDYKKAVEVLADHLPKK